MKPHSRQIVQRLWNYCNVLRDDGLSYGDYVEQLTLLLFLKMSYEQSQPPLSRFSSIPVKYDWNSLLSKEGDALQRHYNRILKTLGSKEGMLGLIFGKAVNKINDPAKLRHLIVNLIDREHWSELSIDIKGDAYEGLLERNAQDTKSGAGQYFTPRPLVESIIHVVDPKPGEVICDPACGTGGFLIAAHDYISHRYSPLTKQQRRHLDLCALRGVELVPGVARLCAMNLLLHGIGPMTDNQGEPPVMIGDSLGADIGGPFEVVLTNPPFGRKSSVTVIGEDANQRSNASTVQYNGRLGGKLRTHPAVTVVRDDFWATSSNKQLNFLQLVLNTLKLDGRAAIVVPDNVLFEAGAGEKIRRRLLQECDVHTLLRLPTGLFYAQGVKANVLFFDRKPSGKKARTKRLWIYDFRSNVHYTFKTKKLIRAHLDEFVTCFHVEDRRRRKPTWSNTNLEGRWRAFSLEELLQREKVNLDIVWLKDESQKSSAIIDTEILIDEMLEELRGALGIFEVMRKDLLQSDTDKTMGASSSN